MKAAALSGAEVAARESMRKAEMFERELGLEVERVDPGRIPPEMTFRQWCDRLAARGMKVDRKPFRLDDRPALLPIARALGSYAGFRHAL